MSLRRNIFLISCAALILFGVWRLAFGVWQLGRQEPPFGDILIFETEMGQAAVSRAGPHVRLEVAGTALTIKHTDNVALVRVNDTGGFYLLKLDKASDSCPTAFTYLTTLDDQVTLSQEFGTCLDRYDAFEDWTGIYVTLKQSDGQLVRYRLEHTGEVRRVPIEVVSDAKKRNADF